MPAGVCSGDKGGNVNAGPRACYFVEDVVAVSVRTEVDVSIVFEADVNYDIE